MLFYKSYKCYAGISGPPLYKIIMNCTGSVAHAVYSYVCPQSMTEEKQLIYLNSFDQSSRDSIDAVPVRLRGNRRVDGSKVAYIHRHSRTMGVDN